MKLWVLSVGVLAIGTMFGLARCTGCGEGYSEGERIGQVTKFSRKGLLVKSWEGEMNLGGMKNGPDGSMANVWDFHAKASLASKVTEAMNLGVPCKIQYRQWMVKPFGQDSNYDLVSIQPLKNP